jgi:putative transposase
MKPAGFTEERTPETELQAQIRYLANGPKRFRYRRLFILPRQGGEPSDVNRIYRLYREERLSLPKRRVRLMAPRSHPATRALTSDR